MTGHTDLTTRARQLVANATPAPWGPTSYRGTGLGWDVEGPEAGIRGQFDVEADAELIAAAPDLITQLCDALDATTNPELATRLTTLALHIETKCDSNGRDPGGTPERTVALVRRVDADDLRLAARIIGGNT